MTAYQVIQEFGVPILMCVIILTVIFCFMWFYKKYGAKGFGFIGKSVEEIGTISGDQYRKNDKITIYKLTDNSSKEISWCLNITTNSKDLSGRYSGEVPLYLMENELLAIIEAFKKA